MGGREEGIKREGERKGKGERKGETEGGGVRVDRPAHDIAEA